MKTIDLAAEVNRWDEFVAAYRSGETVEIVDAGRSVGQIAPRAYPTWNPEDPNAIWDELRKVRESLPSGGEAMAIDDLRNLRES